MFKATCVRFACAFVALILLAGTAPSVFALMTEEEGNKPLNARDYTDWPGIMPVINDKARVYQFWVNGNEQFFYRGDVEVFNEAIKHFARVKVKPVPASEGDGTRPGLRKLVVEPAPGVHKAFHEKTIKHDWNLQIVGGISAHAARADATIGLPLDPTITVYVGKEGLDPAKIVVPRGVTVIDPDGLLKGGKPTPKVPAENLSMILIAPTSQPANRPPVLRLTIRNTAESDAVLNLGMMLANGRKLIPSAITLVVTNADGNSTRLAYLIPGVAGRIDDFIAPLPSGAAYNLRLRMTDYTPLKRGTYRIHAELDAKGAQHINSDSESAGLVAFWKGRLRSDEIDVEIPASR